MMLWWW